MLKRPHVDEFLQKMGELFECVLFTASLAKVCPPHYDTDSLNVNKHVKRLSSRSALRKSLHKTSLADTVQMLFKGENTVIHPCWVGVDSYLLC